MQKGNRYVSLSKILRTTNLDKFAIDELIKFLWQQSLVTQGIWF